MIIKFIRKLFLKKFEDKKELLNSENSQREYFPSGYLESIENLVRKRYGNDHYIFQPLDSAIWQLRKANGEIVKEALHHPTEFLQKERWE